jgi:hypothetical protein
MMRKLLPLAALVLLAFAFLAGCDQPGVEVAAIIGSINIDPLSTSIFGGAEFHVLLCDPDTVIDPSVPGAVDALTPVASVDGTFPGTASTYYQTTNYQITSVPAGTYFAFVWIDGDEDGAFDYTVDYYGFYDANASGSALWSQPGAPNIVVPETGLLDIDIWCGIRVF